MVPNPYAQMVSDAANKYGIDPDLFTRLISQESRFDPNAVSDAGAQGLGQLMPGTAKALGVTNPFDPAQNIDGSARYLKQQMDTFGHPQLALAAYNAGPQRVSDYLSGRTSLPSETTNYVRTISGSPINANLGKTPMANAMQTPMQIAQNGYPASQPPVLFGGQPSQTPLGMFGGLLRALGVGSDEEMGRRLQNAGAGLIAVGDPKGAAALQSSANMPLFRSRFSVGTDAYGRNFTFNNRTGQRQYMDAGAPGTSEQASGGVPAAGGDPTAAGTPAATDPTNAYATMTPAGIKALGDAQIQQSVKDKSKLMSGAQDASALKTLLATQIQLAQDPDVIQGAFAEPREAGADALSYLTGKKYGYNTSAKTDLFNKNNARILGLSKSLLGSNPRLAGPELAYLGSANPGNDKQMDTNLSIYRDMSNLADRTLFAANLAGKTPVLTNDFYNSVNDHFAKMPGYENSMGNNPGAKFTPGGNVDPNSFWKK